MHQLKQSCISKSSFGVSTAKTQNFSALAAALLPPLLFPLAIPAADFSAQHQDGLSAGMYNGEENDHDAVDHQIVAPDSPGADVELMEKCEFLGDDSSVDSATFQSLFPEESLSPFEKFAKKITGGQYSAACDSLDQAPEKEIATWEEAINPIIILEGVGRLENAKHPLYRWAMKLLGIHFKRIGSGLRSHVLPELKKRFAKNKMSKAAVKAIMADYPNEFKEKKGIRGLFKRFTSQVSINDGNSSSPGSSMSGHSSRNSSLSRGGTLSSRGGTMSSRSGTMSSRSGALGEIIDE